MSFTRRLWFLHGRLAISVLFGVAVYLSTISFPSRITTRILVGWDGGALLYLAFLFRLFAHSGIDKIRQRADTGLGDDGHAYVLDDVSGVMAPDEWAKTAIRLLRERMGDRIIAETNNGGEMVENTLRMVDASVPSARYGPHAER